MKASHWSKLAVAGLVAGSYTGFLWADHHEGDGHKHGESEAPAKADEFSEVHGCAGMNVCKGLGGCKVTEEKLAKLAEKAGLELEKAGAAHDCAGLNECKGLGGCKVTEEKFVELKEAAMAAEEGAVK